eukprot:TRINITY_DN8939_c0_g5_i1.p1 TRINITY_DN8939_c0_g5~~TRINITY_DN8939_c0_g5_i1.p1  ORF type:complete len:884 (+),score=215.06 TRINITY_DN8939_c0_g5_i1:108-2759(+)
MVIKVSPIDDAGEGSSRAPRHSIVTPAIKLSSVADDDVGYTLRFRRFVRRILFVSGWYDSQTAIAMRKFFRGRTFAIVAMLCLFAALFLSDFAVVIQASTNLELDATLTVVFLIFFIEFIGLSLTDASYFLSFFFWMDLVGTFSMLYDLSYALGTDAEEPYSATSSTNDSPIVVRAARAAKLGARAGRLSRVLKLLRFLPFLSGDEGEDVQKVKMAKVISNQLQNSLATRVAFLTIVIVVIMPIFGLFTYPEADDSMRAWAEMLDKNAVDYLGAVEAGEQAQADVYKLRLENELTRLGAFYFRSGASYGPFHACLGNMRKKDDFVCGYELPAGVSSNLPFESPYNRPRRAASIMQFSQSKVQINFDTSTNRVEEAASQMGLIVFIVLVMTAFGLLMSSSISTIALQPLERMLSVVRERCAQIFKYTNDLKEDEEEEDSDNEEDYDDLEQSSEFALLEKVVGKLAAIVQLTTAQNELETKENLNEEDQMRLNWMQADQPMHRGRTSMAAMPEDKDGDMQHHYKLTTVSQDVIDSLDTAHFDAIALSKEDKIGVSSYVVYSCPGCESWVNANVPEDVFAKFMTVLESKYPPNPFHNFAHAVDVAYSVSRFFRLMQASKFVSETSQFWMMIAALAHDIGHLGINNQYMIETSHELALKYNDRSPLENMHCSTFFMVVSDPDTNIFCRVEKDLYKEIRKGMIGAILHTDLIQHNPMIKELGMLYQMNSEAFDALDPGSVIAPSASHMQTVLNAILHCADVSNPMKPWKLCRAHAMLILEEFFAQGDLEKATGIPVQMLNDREKVNRPNSQIGFIEFLILPFVEGMVMCFPQLDSLATYLADNIDQWLQDWQQESNPAVEALAKVQARVTKVGARCQAVTMDFRGIRP